MSFSMLLINNNRSKAYLQCMLAEGLRPIQVIVLNAMGKRLAEHTDNDTVFSHKTKQRFIRTCPITGLQFDEKESVEETLRRENISHDVLPTPDPNNPTVVEALGKLLIKNCVYSGPGGVILRKSIFETGVRMLHAHPGIVPEYRGSTTVYYSILLERKIGVTLMILNEQIDEGEVLLQKEFDYVPGINLDYVVDPCVRAKTLIEYVKIQPQGQPQPLQGNTFYIIHPVLKHLAVLDKPRN
jgi:methionyl-tRNA formyltransferase